MVTLPAEFVAIKFPGYFWNLQTKKLFSIKVGGELKELVMPSPTRFNRYRIGYEISVKGLRRYVDLKYLNALVAKDSVVRVIA